MPAVESFADLRTYYRRVASDLPPAEILVGIRVAGAALNRVVRLTEQTTHAQGVETYATLRAENMMQRLDKKEI